MLLQVFDSSYFPYCEQYARTMERATHFNIIFSKFVDI